ncbi:RING finger protein 225-like [Neopelma chrysocephalum]|uniref:RING finger protein 225-like n=1 Tax=Neopelma chrysocephalum TaxID=114329 RepID=UPI000FCD3A07|nr:RING finger protein 225-like [Neopelma chrysocephalum]
MEEARHEAAAPGADRSCLICLGALESPAAVEPCGHVFCRACIQGQAAAAATCPLCREPIGAIRLLQGQDNRAGLAPRRRRRHLHPFVLRWRQERQRRQEEQQQQQQQQPRGPGGRRRRRFSDGDREQSPPVPPRRVRRELEERPHRAREEELASGDHVRRLPFIPFEPEPLWAP